MLEFPPTTSTQYELAFDSLMMNEVRFSDEADPSRVISRCQECGAILRGKHNEYEQVKGHRFEADVAIWARLEEQAEKLDG